MAVAHAKFTGELGVCLSTGGPGATHLITGLYDGKLIHAPVLAICGRPRRPSAEPATNRNLIWTVCSRTWQASRRKRPLPLRCCWTDASGCRWRPTGRRSSSCRKTFRTKSTRSRHSHTVSRDRGSVTAGQVRSRGCRAGESGGHPECRQQVAMLIGAGARGMAPLLIDMATLLGCRRREGAARERRAA